MRARVTDNIPAAQLERQIKLGPGGLRDVEFTVQLLQLVHGRTDPAVRTKSTLDSLAALTRASYISRSDTEAFSRDYKKLRLLEHRIQLMQLRRTHLMPDRAGDNALLPAPWCPPNAWEHSRLSRCSRPGRNSNAMCVPCMNVYSSGRCGRSLQH